MGFRQFFKRAVKPLVVAGIAGTLSVSLVVTTPSNAQAFVAPALPAIYGATTMVIPELMATSAILGPVGWGIAGATVLGIGLYATKDYWLPYVTGAFGAGSEKDNNVTQGGTKVSHTLASVAKSGNTLTLNFTNSTLPPGSSGGWYAHFGVIGKCKDNSTGSIGYKHSGGYWALASNPVASWSKSIALTPCPAYTTMTGYVAGGGDPGGAPTYTPNLDTTQGYEPAKFDSLPTQYNFASRNRILGGDMAVPSFDVKSPELKYRVEAECVSADGKLSTVEALSTGDKAGITFPSCEAAGKGHGTGKVTVWATPPGTQTEQNIWSATAPAPSPDKPLCSPQRAGSGCKLAVKLDTKDCVMGVFECENWADLSKDPNYAPRYSCQYGPYVVPLETCNPLERGYEPGGAPATEPNLDGNPSTRSDAQPDGSTQPKPQTDPNAPPGASLVPGAAGQPSPESSPDAKECFPSGWAVLNPVEWVMKPVGCALDAAFKPKKDLQTRLSGMQGQFSAKVPMSWFGVGMEGVNGGGCPADWAVTFKDHRYSLICGTEAENIIRGFRPVLGSMLIMAMLWPFIRSLFYAAIPVFKVNPS